MDSARYQGPASAPAWGTARAVFLAAAVVQALLLGGGAGGGGPSVPTDRTSCIVAFRLAGEISGARAWGLESPEALAVDHRGDVVIADTGNHRVLVVSPAGEVVTEFGGFGWDDGQFDTPSALAVYAGFYVYVLDEGNRRVQRFDAEGDFVDIVIDKDEVGSPVGLAIGQAGELLVVDADVHAILAWSQFDESIASIGRFGGGEGGLVRPSAVAWGPSREIAVADPGRDAVEVYDEFGSGLYSLTLPDTLEPGGVVFDRAGSLIVSDLRHGRVVAYPPGGGSPSALFEGESELLTPSALAVDRDGGLLVLDGDRGRILLIEMIHGACPSGR